jgi:hypothetical protein
VIRNELIEPSVKTLGREGKSETPHALNGRRGIVKTMNTVQLQRIFQQQSNFLGVFPSDKIPPLTLGRRKMKCLIVNVDVAEDEGSHWVAICFHQALGRRTIEYFDSYGLPPLFPIPKKGEDWLLTYNGIRLQKPQTKVCGQHCIYFLDSRIKGLSFRTIITFLNRKADADDYVRRYVAKKKGKICSFPRVCDGGKTSQCCQRAPGCEAIPPCLNQLTHA